MHAALGGIPNHHIHPGMVEYACDPRGREMEAGGSTVQGQLWLLNKFEASLGFLRNNIPSTPSQKKKSRLIASSDTQTNKKQDFFFFKVTQSERPFLV